MRMKPQKNAIILQGIVGNITDHLIMQTLIKDIGNEGDLKAVLQEDSPEFKRYSYWELKNLIQKTDAHHIIQNYYPKGLKEVTVRSRMEKLKNQRKIWIEKTEAHNDAKVSLNNKYHKIYIPALLQEIKFFEALLKEEVKDKND